MPKYSRFDPKNKKGANKRHENNIYRAERRKEKIEYKKIRQNMKNRNTFENDDTQ